ncbi:hypothetical protein EVAR_26981_1 [Eumeta japonica]|uniref:Uncharacterized protein n=1 Tax=Eumeta variegata TaxID=151549 RepID=A0A4C1VN52_EUMVA|nr:hypothetical protein EVAR_26981_1 [Eumeta japonica]
MRRGERKEVRLSCTTPSRGLTSVKMASPELRTLISFFMSTLRPRWPCGILFVFFTALIKIRHVNRGGRVSKKKDDSQFDMGPAIAPRQAGHGAKGPIEQSSGSASRKINAPPETKRMD